MSISEKSVALVLVSFVAAVAAGCAGKEQAASAAPDDDLGSLAAKQSVTDNGWTMDAQQPTITMTDTVYAAVTFSRTGGATSRPAGACLLVEAFSTVGTTGVACTASNSAGAPAAGNCANITVPTGGNIYCLAPDNVGQKTCWIRPGSQSAYCAGSPASGGTPIGAGTYTTPTVSSHAYAGANNKWMLEGCFAGCSTVTGSMSAALDEQTACTIWGRTWYVDACYDSMADACAANGTYYAPDGQCWPSQAQYECESQPGQGRCLYYSYFDQQCNCIN